MENRFRYTGEQFDTVTGQIYLRARYYDPSIGRFTQEDPYLGDGLNLYTYVSNNPIKYIDPTGLTKCTAANKFDKALDGLQTVLDYAGFIPGFGDIADAINLGISIFRGNVLDAVFSSIAIIPGVGSAIAGPLKTIFHAAGNATELTKAINNLGLLFGGVKEIIPYLDQLYKSFKTFVKKIPNSISSLKDNFIAKNLLGKKKINSIASGVRSGINSLISRADEVIRSIKKTVKKNVKLNYSSETELLLDTMPEFTGTMRKRLLAATQNAKLKEIVNQLYREGATIGDGGTAAALYDEFYKGSSKHLKKAKEKLTGLNKLANSGELD